MNFLYGLERSAGGGIGALEGVAICVLLSLVLGQAIAWTYTMTHSGLSYSRSFTQSLVLLTVIVSLVMLVIGNNIITAFGLIGALAIIRFRNVLKDTRDTVFVFLTLVIGMAVGSEKYVTAVSGTVATLMVMYYLYYTGFGTYGRFDGHLTSAAPGGVDPGSGHFRVIDDFCRSFRRVSLRQTAGGETEEYVFEVRLRRDAEGGALLERLGGMPGVRNVSLVLRDDLSEV